MKIIRVFPKRTILTPKDDYAFIGDPPLDRPEADQVHISVAFTWDLQAAKRLVLAWSQYYAEVYLGGPAYGECNGFSPGVYVRAGVTFTSRGCNNNCPFCLVPEREGKLRTLPISEGNILQDNNILQCPLSHIDSVFDMLTNQYQIQLTGGLEAGRVNQYIADRIRGLRINQLFLACDTEGAIKPLRKALKLLKIPRDKARCYVLLKHNPVETIDSATSRLMAVWEAGAMPFAQLYQPPERYINYPREWRQLARQWSRPAIMKTMLKVFH